MKKPLFMLLFVAIAVLASCEHNVTHDAPLRSHLSVLTRASGDEVISFPVHLYIFKGTSCVALQTLSSADEPLQFTLAEGSYTVCAVGGATSTDYVLPTASEATPNSLLALRDGHSHADLQMARHSVTLTDGEENTLVVALGRKVWCLEQISLSHLPSSATSVSLLVAPLQSGIRLGGNYTDSEQTASIALQKQADGRTWTAPEATYLLPALNDATLTVRIVTPDGTKSYSYACADALEANYRVRIEGTYTEAVGVDLTGTLTGATWAGDRVIRFEFNENGSTTVDDHSSTPADESTTTVDQTLTVGQIYKDCYVLAATSSQATLLSPHEATNLITDLLTDEQIRTQVEAAVPSLAVDGIKGWRMPTSDEIRLFYDGFSSISAALTEAGLTPLSKTTYFVDALTEVKRCDLSAKAFTVSSFPKASTVLRPVAVVNLP